ncbi:DUF1361 domain-containing protein [Demequina sp. B12]|uniref:DUF1361 domain-containing protein n=1 Tax=Demequina sp. B12 TaxID=2992757 RepID=UPI00237AA7D2|nr:DUF1361 domain-containing protein [Demequina sp. B12]MDE0572387.1 DUF1361 domain-containing protein [Demequina sp. B12]
MTTAALALVPVGLLNLYALILIVVRPRAFGVTLYRPMVLNLGLSIVPVAVAVLTAVGIIALTPAIEQLRAEAASATFWVLLGVGTVTWVLFFPNATYLITELNFSHRRSDSPVPLWFDIVQTLSLTLSGIANAIVSLAVMQTLFVLLIVDPGASLLAPWSSWVFAAIVIVLGAWGVYLGRVLRFNSWDVRHPSDFVRKLVSHFREHGKLATAVGFTSLHAGLIALLYAPIYVLVYAALIGL